MNVHDWTDRLEPVVASLRWMNRVAVLSATGSTQDAARRLAGGRPGLIAVAARQTAGRGRHGRSWVQIGDLGVAVTAALDALLLARPHVALAAGVGAAWAIERCLPEPARGRIGIRWPNDVVETERGRKLSGALIERSGGVLLLGVGINVLQEPEDWPEGLAGRAASVRELGGNAERIGVIEHLIRSLDEALSMADDRLLQEWRLRDVLIGRRAVFLVRGRELAGEVEAIRPILDIVVREDSGRRTTVRAADATLADLPG